MNQLNHRTLPDPTNHSVLILRGEFAGRKGVCLGTTHSGLWAVTPNEASEILALHFEDEFGILVNTVPPAKNN